MRSLAEPIPGRVVESRSGWIDVISNLPESDVQLDYRVNGGELISYRVRLEALTKHFGGCEWYFICPNTGKRCRTLYGISKYFLSRFAYPSAVYSSQTKSKRWKAIRMVFDVLAAEKPFDKKYSRTHYKGKPTSRFISWLSKLERRERVLLNREQLGPLFN